MRYDIMETCPLAGELCILQRDVPYLHSEDGKIHAGEVCEVVDWFENVAGESWRTSTLWPAERYAERVKASNGLLPDDDYVLYVKFHYGFTGFVLHVTDITVPVERKGVTDDA